MKCIVYWWMQFMSEKIGGAKGTELDDDYILMEKVWIPLFGC